jgi:transcriptional regulator with XRE-family HTH domain
MSINSPPKEVDFNLDLLPSNILFERMRLKLTQRALAKELGFKGVGTVTFWESGKFEPPLATFLKLCKFFGRTPNEMLTSDLRTLSPPPHPPERPPSGENTEGVLQESGGVARAAPLPQNKGDDLKEMRRQMLDIMIKIESMDSTG